MKARFNIFIILGVCLCLAGVLRMVRVSADESSGWNPNDLYELSAVQDESLRKSPFTNATLSDAKSDNVLPSFGGRMSWSTRAPRANFSYAHVSDAPASSLTSSPSTPAAGVLYTTSSAEYRSFGGGRNGGNFVSSSGGFVASSAASPIASSASALNAFSPVSMPRHASAGSNVSGGVEQMVEQVAEVAVSGYSSSFATGYALNTSYGTASYDELAYGGYGNRNSMPGRQNAPSSGLGNSWLNWLDDYYSNTLDWWNEDKGNGNSTTLDWQAAYNAYWAMLDSWNYTMGNPPTWEEFEAWLWKSKGSWYEKNGHSYTYVPVGDVLPLLILALLYMVILVVKRNKFAQL